MFRASKGNCKRHLLCNVWLMLAMSALCCMSCENSRKQELQSQVEALYGREVDLCTERMLTFYPKECSPCGHPRNARLNIVSFVDTASCSPCAMQNLLGWCGFIDSLDTYKGKIGAYFIFDTSHAMQEKAIEEAPYVAEDIGVPIYVDTLHIFAQTNRLSLSKRTQVFALDDRGKICLVGNPTENRELEELFWEIVERRHLRN